MPASALLAGLLALAGSGCQQILDAAGIEGDEREQLEELGRQFEDSFEDEFGVDLDPDSKADPNWSDETGVPEPPGEPERTGDTNNCPDAFPKGKFAQYANEEKGNIEPVSDHYEDFYGREPDQVRDTSELPHVTWEDEETGTHTRVYRSYGVDDAIHVVVCTEE